MPDAAWHLAKAARFEGFLDEASVIEAQHPEWIVIAHFYTVLHYVDAFYATKGHALTSGSRSTRQTSSVRNASTLK